MDSMIAALRAAPWGWAAALYLLTFLLTVVFLLLRSLWSAMRVSRRCTLTDQDAVPPPEDRFDFGNREEREVLVTLVHGTWGRRSSWHQQGSRFQKALAGELRHRGFRVRFRRFLWSGSNSVSERERAARVLRREMSSGRGGDAVPAEFIVAHSHGGNVVLRALLCDHEKQGTCSARIAGVSCLGAPFLVGSPRERRFAPILAVALGPLIAAIVLAFRPPLDLPPAAELMPGGAAGWPAAIALLLGFVAAGLWIGLQVKACLLPGTGLPGAVGRKLFVLRACGDEASGALGVAYMATWLVNKLTALLALPLLGISDGAGAIVRGMKRGFRGAFLVVAGSAAAIALALRMFGDLSGEEAWTFAIGGFFVALLVPMLHGLVHGAVRSFRTGVLVTVELVSQVVLGALLLPFGPELILASRFVLITSEAVPPVENGDRLAAVVQLGLREGKRASLQHTVYNHPRTPAYLAEWIEREYPAAALHDNAAAAVEQLAASA